MELTKVSANQVVHVDVLGGREHGDRGRPRRHSHCIFVRISANS